MKLRKEFLLHITGNDSVLVPTGAAGFSGIVRGNATLGETLELLKADVTEAELVAAMKARYDAPEGAIEDDVASVLAKLRRIGALDE